MSSSAMERKIAHLESLLTPTRVKRMRGVLATRSDHVAFVFERMIDPHNFSAALRSLDAISFQDVHLVQPGERLEFSRGITIGTDRWLTLHRAESTAACLSGLKQAGYKVLASHLDGGDATPLRAVDFAEPLALVFGNEHRGVGQEVLDLADGRFRIEMLGFAQSYNLSVSVALTAFHARSRIEEMAATDEDPQRFFLRQERRQQLYFQWLRQSVKNADKILAELEAGHKH